MVLVRGILLLSVAVLPVATAETTAAGQEGKIAKNANTGCVAVTGATGFVAGHVIELLLDDGYTVHGTVRDPGNKAGNAFLHDLAATRPGTLKLFAADLLDADPFTEAFAGCWGLLHIASAVARVSDDPQDTLRPAVAGTVAALDAAMSARMQVVVVTSSTAAVGPTFAKRDNRPGDNPYTVTDHNDVATLNFGTYAYSKVMAEQQTETWMAEHSDASGRPPFRYASIHFPWGTGPQQTSRVTSSNKLQMMMLTGQLPLLIPVSMHITDVRDVARAHVHCLTDGRASGRYIVAPEPGRGILTTAQMARYIQEAIPEAPVPRFTMPQWVAWCLVKAGYDRNMDAYMYATMVHGPGPGYISNMAELGFHYLHTDPRKSVQDAALSMKALGVMEQQDAHGGSRGSLYAATAAVVAVVAVIATVRRLLWPGTSIKSKYKAS